MEKKQRITMIERILDASPKLAFLAVSWKDFRHCSRKYLNLRHVHLMLNGVYNNPNRYFDIHRLNELAPHLYSLETSDAVMMLNKYLIKFILNINHRFDQLVHLVLNKNCLYRSKDEKKIIFIDKLIAATHDQIFHGNNIHFQFRRYDELRIWL